MAFWNQAICRMPTMLITAGIHSPVKAMPRLVQAEGFVIAKRDST